MTSDQKLYSFMGMRIPKANFATMEEMCRIAECLRPTLYRWVSLGLLPPPTGVSDGSGGIRVRWSLEAKDRARFVVEKMREKFQLDEIREMVFQRWGRPTDEDLRRQSYYRNLRHAKAYTPTDVPKKD